MNYINKRLVGIILILASIGIMDAYSQHTYQVRNDSKGFYLYGGLNWKFINGSRVSILDPNKPDPIYPFADSILHYSSLAPHFGANYNFEILKSLNLRVGIELNLRKYSYKIYYDSIRKAENPVLNDVRRRTNYYNIEIPTEIAYNIHRFGFGIAAKFIVYEIQVRKYYLSDAVDSKYYDHHLLFRIHQPKILYPNAFIEFLAFQNPKLPVWIKAAYEYGGNYSSTVFLSLKTKL